ncbi:MAG: MATE family efflux transporter [Wujia sp.]
MEETKSATKDLTVGSPMKLILGFAFPMFLGLLLQQCYTLIDTMIVGKYLGVEPFAGVGSTGSLSFITIGFCIGVCSGFAVPVAQRFGAKDEKGLRKMVANSIWLCVILGGAFTLLMLVFCKQILNLMNTPDNIYRYAFIYIFILFAGIPCTMLYNMTASIIRALGDSKSPILFLAISSVMNIGLDFLLIVGLHMNVEGAALATVISQGVSGVICVIYMKKKFAILKMQKGDMQMDIKAMKTLFGIGIPMGLQYSITGIGSVILQSSVNNLGYIYVASMTAAGRINGFLMCPLDALGQSMAPYAGQNIGAKKIDRVGKGLGAAIFLGCIVSVVMLLISHFFGGSLARLFLDEENQEIMKLCAQFLRIVSYFFCLLTLVNTVRFTIQGMGFSTFAILAGVLEMIARGVAGLVLVPAFGFVGACFSSPLAWLMADLFLVPAFFYCTKRVRRTMEITD